MSKYRDLLERCETLVIFKSLKEDEVVHALLETLAAAEDECSDSVSWYCEFVSLLYKHGDNLTKYILKLVLENENLYMLRRGSGEQTGELLDECLANELFLLEELAEISCEELTDSLDFDGFLPRYNTEKADFSKIYADRIHNIAKYGYGIYSQYHVFVIDNGKIVPVEYPDSISLSQLSGYERERGEVIDNTLALLAGKPANNVLLYGDCGTGKSSTVKAVANEYADRGLKIIQMSPRHITCFPKLFEQTLRSPFRFIVFLDDLTFDREDDNFAALKAFIEGGLAGKPSNLVIYATSNRRHLIRESMADRQGDDVRVRDTLETVTSLSDRFGLEITFSVPDKDEYLYIVEQLADESGLALERDELHLLAERFALRRNGRSPRTARQFISQQLAEQYGNA